MKLYNTIIAFDVYVVAESEESARAAAMVHIREGLNASHSVALEIKASPVRAGWQMERPLVGEDVSDADFERIKGKTTQQVHDLLNKKRP